MTKIRKGYNSKILSIIASALFLSHALAYASPLSSVREYLRVPMRDHDRIEQVLSSPSNGTRPAEFNPVQIPIQDWHGPIMANIENMGDPRQGRVVFEREEVHDKAEGLRKAVREGIPFRDLLIDILLKLDYQPEISRNNLQGSCHVWTCAAAYVLKDLPYIEGVKVMRTKDDTRSWLAVRFKGVDRWYAFSRTIGQLPRYRHYTFGIYLPLKNAQRLCRYFSDAYSVELIFPDEEALLDGVTKFIPKRESLRKIKEEAIGKTAVRQRLAQLGDLRRGIEEDRFRRVATFGDQHGQNAVLKRIVRAVKRKEVDEVVGLGDAFDYGDENRKNLRTMRWLKKGLKDRASFVFGNHDVLFIQALLLGDLQAWLDWVNQGGRALREEFGGKDQPLKELALWMLQNFKLFHIDERGVMYVHAGIPMDDEGRPLISREELNMWQEELEAIQREMAEDPAGFMKEEQNKTRVANLFDETKQIFWVRVKEWIYRLAEDIDDECKKRLDEYREQILAKYPNARYWYKDQPIEEAWRKIIIEHDADLEDANIKVTITQVDKEKMDRFLARLGINGIVFGHEWQDYPMNLDNRIFCMDVCRGDNGFLVLNREGIGFHPVARQRTGKDLIVQKSAVIAGIDREIARLEEILERGMSETTASTSIRQDRGLRTGN